MNVMSMRRVPGPRGQRGNALVLALLALAVTGLGAATALQSKRLDLKRDAGMAEATVLERLRNGVQAAVHENLTTIQQGQAIVKDGVTVEAELVHGNLVWSPTIEQLRAMGYLPSGWTSTRSLLNDGVYGVSWQRVPAGCDPVACDVEGLVTIRAPVLDGGPGSPVDGVLIGPILTRSGADGGVSLAATPATIQGFNGTWSQPNPVPGNPAGVVAMRVGTNTGGLSQFVRVGDLRDPKLSGNLSAAGNVSVGGTSAFTGNASFNADAAIHGAVRVGPSGAAPCVSMDPRGVLSILCTGTLNTRSGVFEDAVGNRSEVTPNGVTTSGRIRGDDGFQSNGNVVFSGADPNAISVSTGELFFRGPAGTLLSLQDGGVVINGELAVDRLSLNEQVTEGAVCASGGASSGGVGLALTAERSVAVCVGGRWAVSSRLGAAGAACLQSGQSATDSSDGQALLCRSGRYIRTAALISNFVLVQTLALQFSGSPVSVSKPNCAASGSSAAEPLIILSPNNEDVAMSGATTLSGVNRFAIDNGDRWSVVLERSADFAGLSGNMIANIYCHYS